MTKLDHRHTASPKRFMDLGNALQWLLTSQKWRQPDIMHLWIAEHNTIYEIFLLKVEPECYRTARRYSQKTQETEASHGDTIIEIQMAKKNPPKTPKNVIF